MWTHQGVGAQVMDAAVTAKAVFTIFAQAQDEGEGTKRSSQGQEHTRI